MDGAMGRACVSGGVTRDHWKTFMARIMIESVRSSMVGMLSAASNTIAYLATRRGREFD